MEIVRGRDGGAVYSYFFFFFFSGSGPGRGGSFGFLGCNLCCFLLRFFIALYHS